MNIKKKAQMYGNMTGVEKQINKDEMLAYRNHDTQPYMMIPGLNSSPPKLTKKLEQEKQRHTGGRTHESDVHRLKQYGLT